MMPSSRKVKPFFVDLARRFFEVETPRLAAALAFYLSISFAPIVIVFIALTAGLNPEVVNELDMRISAMAGAGAGILFRSVADYARENAGWSTLAGSLSFVFLVFSSSIIFGELRADLNKIFGISNGFKGESISHYFLNFLRSRIAEALLVLGFFAFLILSMVGSAALETLHPTGPKIFYALFDTTTSLFLYVIAFTLMLRYVPDQRQSWVRSFEGGFIIAALFTIGKEIIAYYLSKTPLSSVYGPASSGIVFFIWVYYIATVIFLGAEASILLRQQGGDYATRKQGELFEQTKAYGSTH